MERKGSSVLIVDPYEISQRIGKFSPGYVKFSMLQKCSDDLESTLPIKVLDVQENLSYEDVSVEIFYRQIKELRN